MKQSFFDKKSLIYQQRFLEVRTLGPISPIFSPLPSNKICRGVWAMILSLGSNLFPTNTYLLWIWKSRVANGGQIRWIWRMREQDVPPDLRLIWWESTVCQVKWETIFLKPSMNWSDKLTDYSLQFFFFKVFGVAYTAWRQETVAITLLTDRPILTVLDIDSPREIYYFDCCVASGDEIDVVDLWLWNCTNFNWNAVDKRFKIVTRLLLWSIVSNHGTHLEDSLLNPK